MRLTDGAILIRVLLDPLTPASALTLEAKIRGIVTTSNVRSRPVLCCCSRAFQQGTGEVSPPVERGQCCVFFSVLCRERLTKG